MRRGATRPTIPRSSCSSPFGFFGAKYIKVRNRSLGLTCSENVRWGLARAGISALGAGVFRNGESGRNSTRLSGTGQRGTVFALALMTSRIPFHLWSRAALHAGLAIVVVVIALVDLGTTLPCCAEDFGIPVCAADSGGRSAAGRVNEELHDQECLPSPGERSTDHPLNDSDGCFCCALGILATLPAAEQPSGLDPALEPSVVSLPTSPPNSPYRPPRIA